MDFAETPCGASAAELENDRRIAAQQRMAAGIASIREAEIEQLIAAMRTDTVAMSWAAVEIAQGIIDGDYAAFLAELRAAALDDAECYAKLVAMVLRERAEAEWDASHAPVTEADLRWAAQEAME